MEKCEYCGKECDKVVKNLCRTCYQRARQRGGDPAKIKVRTVIACASCEAETDRHVRNLCPKCYQRFLRHGHTDQTRPQDWGAREKHPLYQSWIWLKRYNKTARHLCREWHNFWTFVEDVKQRPSDQHRLRRPDESKPYAKDNFEWEKFDPAFRDLDERARRAAYARRYRVENPEKLKNASLKQNFGITLADFRDLQQSQNNVCAICGKPEISKIRGVVLDLAVDHCHATGKVRGLLCHHCNKSLGGFKDSIDNLKSAISYLERHQNA